MRILKSEKCDACGQITNERYRQMKLLNRKRWEQIQALEIKLEQLQAKLNLKMLLATEGKE